MDTIVTIHPNELALELHPLLLHKVRTRMEQGECTRDNGYLIDVLQLREVLDNKVSYDGSILVHCVFDVVYFKPEVGLELEETVVDVFEQGIFCNLKSRIRTLIPRVSLEWYTYTKQGYTTPQGETIRPGSKIQLQITQTRYLNGNYSCIARILR